MRLILIHDVDDLGQKGDVVDVADGYARNYLVPRSLAVKATEGALRQAETMRLVNEEALAAAKDDAETFAQSLTGTRVVVAAHAGDEGKLYGSIGEADIAKAITMFTGIEVDPKLIVLETPIKDIGLHEVALRPHPEVELMVTLDVIPA
ncbi:MAG: 50S ribosomal protein L9 [Acidimicrobiia bacterium]|nr:MAG: 50S ribosomal protein L9 [Acidimicrobiia bacterium]